MPQAVTFDSIASANLVRDRTIGAVVAIVKGQDILFVQRYGKADVESDVEMRADAVFAIGSITRQFTAAAILRLRDQGKLDLDEDITKWFPDFDTRGARIPLRRVEGLTFRQGGILLIFRRENGDSGPVTELRCDTGTEHSILVRPQPAGTPRPSSSRPVRTRGGGRRRAARRRNRPLAAGLRRPSAAPWPSPPSRT